MTYQAVPTADGDLFFINPDIMQMILHNAAYEEGKRDFSVPKDGFYVTDFSKAKAQARHAGKAARVLFEQRGSPLMALFRTVGESMSKTSKQPTTRDILRLREYLHQREKNGRDAIKQHMKSWNAFHNKKVEKARTSADRWGQALTVATVVRDAAIEVYSVVPITAPIGVLAKGAAVYQDTGDFGAASAKLGTEIALIVVPSAIRNRATAYIVSKATEFTGDTVVGYLSDPKASLKDSALRAGVSTALSVGFDGLGKRLGLDNLTNAKSLNERELSRLLRAMPKDEIMLPVGLSMMKTAEGGLKNQAADQVVELLNARHAKGKQLLRDVNVSHPVMADLAILGPNMSQAGRRWPAMD